MLYLTGIQENVRYNYSITNSFHEVITIVNRLDISFLLQPQCLLAIPRRCQVYFLLRIFELEQIALLNTVVRAGLAGR